MTSVPLKTRVYKQKKPSHLDIPTKCQNLTGITILIPTSKISMIPLSMLIVHAHASMHIKFQHWENMDANNKEAGTCCYVTVRGGKMNFQKYG